MSIKQFCWYVDYDGDYLDDGILEYYNSGFDCHYMTSGDEDDGNGDNDSGGDRHKI